MSSKRKRYRVAFLMNVWLIQMSDTAGSTTESAADKGLAVNKPANTSSQNLNQESHGYVIYFKLSL